MNLEIGISDTKVRNFSNQAKIELQTQIIDISDKLVDEALRVETSERLSGDVQEVTTSIVKKAAELFLRRYDYVKKKPRKVWFDSSSNASFALMGLFFTLAFSGSSVDIGSLALGILFLAVGIATLVFSITKGYYGS